MTSFFDAIAAGDYDEVETHLNAGADPNAPGSANLPPLHAAVAASEGELIRLLASRGADLERRDGWRRTALMLAAASNEVECAEMLVALGADPAEAQELAGDNEELLAVLLGETLERVGALSLGGAPAAPPVLASFVPTGSNKRRRGSVSSESYNPAAADAAVLGSTSRTPAEAARIERAIGSSSRRSTRRGGARSSARWRRCASPPARRSSRRATARRTTFTSSTPARCSAGARLRSGRRR